MCSRTTASKVTSFLMTLLPCGMSVAVFLRGGQVANDYWDKPGMPDLEVNPWFLFAYNFHSMVISNPVVVSVAAFAITCLVWWIIFRSEQKWYSPLIPPIVTGAIVGALGALTLKLLGLGFCF